jgi:hypothetical protein
VLIIQDIHQVVGRRELDFEAMYRQTLHPALQSDSDARLLYFAWCPHGGGEGYEAVTLTLVSDGAALDRYQERLRFGDLGTTATELEAMRYTCESSLHIVGTTGSEWESRLAPDDGGAETPLYRIDFLELAVPFADVQAALATQHQNESLLTPVAWWSPFLGDGAERTVTALHRINSRDALTDAFRPEHAGDPWTGGLEDYIPAAVIARRSKLLRSADWTTSQS